MVGVVYGAAHSLGLASLPSLTATRAHVHRYHTFCNLAGVDYLDKPAGLPSNEDSLDVWPFLSGQVADSPRKELPIAIEGTAGGRHAAAIT